MSKHIKETVIEVLEEGESTIFGKPSGKYWLRCYEDDNDAYSFECLEDVVQVLDEENAFYGNLDYSNGGVVYWLSENSSKCSGHIDADTLDVILYSIHPDAVMGAHEDLKQFMNFGGQYFSKRY